MSTVCLFRRWNAVDYTGRLKLPEHSVCTVKNNTIAFEKWMNMTRNPRKSYSRTSSFMIAKEDSDAKGDLVTICNSSSSSSRKNNIGEDGGGDDDDDNNNNNNINNKTF